ncbi:MAG: hypothetical protein MRK02_16505 [Candidatus Scalindua sp.]|nr:hypothetical protein [Candidatus Scalindua sp.]
MTVTIVGSSHVIKGLSLVLTEEGLILGLPRDETLRGMSDLKRSVLSPVVDVRNPVLVKAVQNWKKMTKGNQVPFQFKTDRKNWWGEFRSYLLGNRTFWIGVVVPASDFLGGVKRQGNFILCITFGSLVLTIIIAIF